MRAGRFRGLFHTSNITYGKKFSRDSTSEEIKRFLTKLPASVLAEIDTNENVQNSVFTTRKNAKRNIIVFFSVILAQILPISPILRVIFHQKLQGTGLYREVRLFGKYGTCISALYDIPLFGLCFNFKFSVTMINNIQYVAHSLKCKII